MRVLLTGATGFVGSHVSKDLIQRGHEVYALVRPTSRHQFLKEMGVNLVFGSLEKLDHGQTTFPKIDSVIHNAGIIKARRAAEFYSVNTDGTRKLLQALDGQHLKRFVFVSSVSARGPNRSSDDYQGLGPVSHYGRSKLKAEELVLSLKEKFPVTIMRPPIVYGPGDQATLSFFKMFQKGILTVPHGGNEQSSFIYVKDLSRVLVASVEANGAEVGPFYPEDGSGGYSWQEVASIAEKIYKKRIRKIGLPLWAVRLAAAVNESSGKIFGFTPFFSLEKFQEMKQPFWTCSSVELQQAFGLPAFTNLETGFSQTKEWYEKEGWL